MIDFAELELTAHGLAAKILDKQADLIRILTQIETCETARDEIKKSRDCLLNLRTEQDHFVGSVHHTATLMPLNLPLYSLILFGVVPSYLSHKVSVKPPALLLQILEDIAETLELAKTHGDVAIYHGTKEQFLSEHIAQCDVTIFTGHIRNADKIRKHIRKDGLFLFNGRGVNPIVVGANADVGVAAAKTVDVKIFNSGQDCAAPDIVFVHKSLSREFLQAAEEYLSRIKVGCCSDPGTRVGRLLETNQLLVAADHLSKHSCRIVHGGRVDFREHIVYPTLLFVPDFTSTNYKEFFSPILHVTEYRDDDDLRTYFETDQYKYNAMYISLFGDSDYISHGQLHSIVLHNKIVHEHERGNLEYGGFSHGASFVQKGRTSVARPILVSREIAEFLQWRELDESGFPSRPISGAGAVQSANGAGGSCPGD